MCMHAHTCPRMCFSMKLDFKQLDAQINAHNSTPCTLIAANNEIVRFDLSKPSANFDALRKDKALHSINMPAGAEKMRLKLSNR